ncbi:hypothetical protein AURDEDRAFT_174505 [Auricularia subglabra TFB-10046 SS5]|uniref:Uncharacterized protein n=1 Tax=Auricularia subglabra (strain TFB-10046 / SS5) TaxID=717982 RepID=J0WUK7_AURST|nr:hypothetical protein AURDEDRAFT_174505 [Auricularia subglabra TFB-10046 SS5]
MSLAWVHLATPFGLVGPATTNLDFSDLESTFSEPHEILIPATNLERLSLLFCGIIRDSRGAPALHDSQPLSPPGLDEVGVYSFRTEIPPELALDFPCIGKLGNIAYLEISRGSLHTKNAAGMDRNLGGDLGSFDFLFDVLSEKQLIHAESPEHPSVIQPGRVAADEALFAGDRIFAPGLHPIHVSVSGSGMPTLALVHHYICALGCFLPSSLSSVTMTYHDVSREDAALLERFLTLYELKKCRRMAAIPRDSW